MIIVCVNKVFYPKLYGQVDRAKKLLQFYFLLLAGTP